MQIPLAEARLRSSIRLEADGVRHRTDKLPTQLYETIVYLPAHPADPPVAPSSSSTASSRPPAAASRIEY